MRTARQWRQCKLYKWHGFANDDRDPNSGQLALFCPACPQPDINIQLSAAMDGNFKAEHLYPSNVADKVYLMDGQGFMVTDTMYRKHLSLAQDIIQRSECNNHWAVNQANALRHNLEATGIGGCACARHGCFVPGK